MTLFFVLKFQFLPLGETQKYDMYYISENGSDTSTCGKTAGLACKSLENVLGIYYNKPQLPQIGLLIISSKSLTINQRLVVSYKAFNDLICYICLLIISVSARHNFFRLTTQGL